MNQNGKKDDGKKNYTVTVLVRCTAQIRAEDSDLACEIANEAFDCSSFMEGLVTFDMTDFEISAEENLPQ